MSIKKGLWGAWLVLCVVIAVYFGKKIFLENQDKSVYLIGETTYGHHQIEMSCDTCHTSAFGGTEVLQNACLQCHADELDEAQDSHPKSKFTDPREAFRLENVDARYCVSCHVEHQRDATHPMGVTLPKDYCYHCHQETIEDRESHKDLPFDSCADAGCHNYHDNRALYESFLVKHSAQPWISEAISVAQANYSTYKAVKLIAGTAVVEVSDDVSPDVPHDWLGSAHQQANISCASCHSTETSDGGRVWKDKPGVFQCQQCHQQEAAGFKAGKHGMRLATMGVATTLMPHDDTKIALVTPSESHLDFHNNMFDASHGCNACHGAHSYDTTYAAFEACLSCHKDEHTLSYRSSPHGLQRKKVLEQSLPLDDTVSCATCHMPRVSAGKIKTNFGTQIAKDKNKASEESEIALWRVEHNQNWNLRPNEKMIRPVCMSCHSLEFSIDALADQALIQSNFNGQPSVHIESMDWALEREQR